MRRVVLALVLLIPGFIGVQDRCCTFEHQGKTYEVSEAYQEGTWYDSQDFCTSLGEDWRLPTLEEAIAMRNGYSGQDPLDIVVPSFCQGHESMDLRELWTSTECSDCGRCYDERGAYTVHRVSVQVVDDYVPSHLSCQHEEFGDENGHYCCVVKQGYGVIHICPQARCVRVIGGGPPPFRLWLPLVRRR